MSEAQEAPNTNANAASQGDCLCCRIQKAAEEIAAMFLPRPPQSANKHFCEARIEVLRGIREMIDYRIEALSRANKAQGSRIVVE